MRGHLVRGGARVAPDQDHRRVDRHRCDRDHRRARKGTFEVIGQMLIARQAIMGRVGCMGTKDDAVLEGPVTQFERERERV